MLLKCCIQYVSKLKNSAMATGQEKVSFHSNPKEGQCQRMFRLLYNCTHFHMPGRLCSKFFKLGFNSTWTKNFLVFKLDLEKAEEPEIKLPTSAGSWKSTQVPEKHLLLLYWVRQSLWLWGSQQTAENSSRDGNTRPPNLPPKKSVCRSRSNS